MGLPSKMKLYVVRVSGNDPDKLLNSRPCNNCIEYMKLFGIKYVFYSNEFGEITKEKVDTMELLHDSLAFKIYMKSKTQVSELKKKSLIAPDKKSKSLLNPGPI